MKNLKIMVIASLAVIASGCASTANKNIDQINTASGGGVARAVTNMEANLVKYSGAINFVPQYIFFKITEDGVWVDQKNTQFDQKKFLAWRGRDERKDCMAIVKGAIAYCNFSVQFSMQPPTIFMKKEFSASNSIISAVVWPIALISLASGNTSGIATKNKLDNESLKKIGSYVLDGLIKDVDLKYSSIEKQVGMGKAMPEQLLEFAREYPGDSRISDLYRSILRQAVGPVGQVEGWSSVWLRDIASGRHGSKAKELMVDSLGEAIASSRLNDARIYRSALKESKVVVNSDLESRYKELALRSGRFDDVYEFASAGDVSALKLAWNKAATPEEKSKSELALVKVVAPKLLNIDTGIRSSGGAVVEGSKGGAIASMFGAKVTSSAVADVVYNIKLDPDVFKITQAYKGELGIKFVAVGVRNWEKNCGFLWLDTCKGQDEDFEEVYRGKGDFVVTPQPDWEGRGVIAIKWQPVRAGSGVHGGYLMGGSQAFSAHSVRAVVDYVKILDVVDGR